MDEREVGRVVRSAAESVYGVTAVVGSGWVDRLATRLGLGSGGVSISRDSEGRLRAEIDIRVADSVPADQVAANVAEKVRYIVERDLTRHIDTLVVRVDGRPVALPPATSE